MPALRPWLLASVLLVAGCTSRTLPLPPPVVDRAVPTDSGTIAVSGFALSGATVGVFNEDMEKGVVVVPGGMDCDNRCPFEAEVPGVAGDTLRVWQFFATSNSTFLTVEAP